MCLCLCTQRVPTRAPPTILDNPSQPLMVATHGQSWTHYIVAWLPPPLPYTAGVVIMEECPALGLVVRNPLAVVQSLTLVHVVGLTPPTIMTPWMPPVRGSPGEDVEAMTTSIRQ